MGLVGKVEIAGRGDIAREQPNFRPVGAGAALQKLGGTSEGDNGSAHARAGSRRH